MLKFPIATNGAKAFEFENGASDDYENPLDEENPQQNTKLAKGPIKNTEHVSLNFTKFNIAG